MQKTAIIVMNMGGPDSLESVEPFLFNLFMDPDIIEIPLGRLFRPFIARRISKKRSRKVMEYYRKIGGKSPIKELTLDQADRLADVLKKEGSFSTHVAMRYWHPFTEEAIADVLRENPSRIVLLPLYPQFSKTTSGSSINEFRRQWASMGKKDIDVIEIRKWNDHTGYIRCWADSIRETMEKEEDKKTHLIFSAHGTPQKLVDEGDPYQQQTEETVRLILNELEWKGEWHLTYQSRVGPVKWLEPSTEETLRMLGENGAERIVMVPISFVSDHSETLYEMDIEYRELAKKAGVGEFIRVPSLNSQPNFIEALKDIVLKAVKSADREVN